ncbi:hypothetical protein GQ457_10G012710 [Hibiscus cannabinus]
MTQTSGYMARTDQFIQNTDAFMDRTEMRMQNQEDTLKSLENQVAQISQAQKSRPVGRFPNDTEVAKGATHEQCKAIATRSGRKKQDQQQKHLNPNQSYQTNGGDKATPTIPTKAEQKQDYQFKKFFDILKQVHMNLPLVEAVQQMPNYVKFLKDMVSRKCRIGEFEKAAATETCLALMHNKVPAKKTDHGSFTIECSIEYNYSTKALCEPGESINLLPKSVFQKHGIGEAKPTTVMLQLADHSFVQPEGKIKDILVRVEKFIFPADLLILDCEADENAPIILGRPFLATGRVLLDFGNDEPGKYFEPLNYTNENYKTDKPSIEEPPKLELKILPEQLKYAYLGKDKNTTHIKGISPTICMHNIVLEDNQKPTVDAQRRLNQAMKDVVRKEILKWLDARIIYPISDSEWVSPVQCVPKKGGITVISNENNELIPTMTVIGWRVCMDYQKLNKATRKDHFSLPFIDQMLDRLAGKPFYYFLDGYSGYNQIAIAPEDQSKTTYTCPYGTFAFRRMPFVLCNAPATFQRCMTAIFSDMNEDCSEIFMDDFSTFGDDFDCCLSNLEKVLTRCKESNLVLNWEKCHFMVDEGILLGHKISSRGMEVDIAKIDVISKLLSPTTVNGTHSFLGHA